jgi:hypothetical protein
MPGNLMKKLSARLATTGQKIPGSPTKWWNEQKIFEFNLRFIIIIIYFIFFC